MVGRLQASLPNRVFLAVFPLRQLRHLIRAGPKRVTPRGTPDESPVSPCLALKQGANNRWASGVDVVVREGQAVNSLEYCNLELCRNCAQNGRRRAPTEHSSSAKFMAALWLQGQTMANPSQYPKLMTKSPQGRKRCRLGLMGKLD